jgi:hypothetical protein
MILMKSFTKIIRVSQKSYHISIENQYLKINSTLMDVITIVLIKFPQYRFADPPGSMPRICIFLSEAIIPAGIRGMHWGNMTHSLAHNYTGKNPRNFGKIFSKMTLFYSNQFFGENDKMFSDFFPVY